MPGIFGGIGGSPTLYDALQRDFSRIWNGCEIRRINGYIIGGHAFGRGSAIHTADGELLIGIDGEWSIYRWAEKHLPARPDRLFRIPAGCLELAPACKGNLAVIDPAAGVLHIAAEWSGSFPLYYGECPGGLLFSSHLRPLARAMAASRDELGILQFLRYGYTIAGRTQFARIKRLLPGQALRYERRGRLQLYERSRLWVDADGAIPDRDDVADACWTALRDSLRTSIPSDQPSTLMMSAGWDSRTLLAGALATSPPDRLICYSHGDPDSRELRLVEQMCRSTGTDCQLVPIDDAIYDLESLQRGFDRVENVVFPHWHRAGALLAEAGVGCVLAGVYGEILGGHYGHAMLTRGGKKVLAVASTLLGRQPSSLLPTSGDDGRIRNVLRIRRLGGHWYLNQEFERAIHNAREAINADIDADLNRLRERGIVSGDHLVEAFISEHRGSQYINAQILSCRAYVDVALPFADREALHIASCISLPAKMHNKINRSMLRRYHPALLRYPLAATLVPAAAPIPAQEASRLVRSIRETARWRLHFATRGAVPPPRLGWVNFEFLRNGRSLRMLIDDLSSEIWDRAALRKRILEIEDMQWRNQLHPIFDQTSKIYTIDLLLR